MLMVGVLSAIVDNIPIMFAVLTMDPQMSHGQWLLVTLTAGVGGSMFPLVLPQVLLSWASPTANIHSPAT